MQQQPTFASHYFSTDKQGYSWACIADIMQQAQEKAKAIKYTDIRISRVCPSNRTLETADHTAFFDSAGNRAKNRAIPPGHVVIHIEGWTVTE